MNPQSVLNIGQEALLMLLRVSAPVLIAVLVVGLVVSVFQAVTQINESTLSFLPKLLVAVAVLGASGSWMLATLVDYIRQMLTAIPSMVT